jgi:hypothetical protein
VGLAWFQFCLITYWVLHMAAKILGYALVGKMENKDDGVITGLSN